MSCIKMAQGVSLPFFEPIESTMMYADTGGDIDPVNMRACLGNCRRLSLALLIAFNHETN